MPKRINRRDFVGIVGAGFAALSVPSIFSCSKPVNQPNILFILVDDMGWRQLGCYGSSYYETPNIDKIAREGMKFTDAYAACPVCSPTRASIITGKYPARLHLTDFIPGSPYLWNKLKQPEWTKYLPLEELTIAEVLKEAGYATASFGKWHLSIAKRPPQSEPFNPDKQGFDEYYVTYKPKHDQYPAQDAHNVGAIIEKSLHFMEKNKDKPFFLYVTHNTIHNPLIEKQNLISKYKNKHGFELPENRPVIGAMIETLDQSVGRLLQKLKDLKIEKNTIVIFFSDNGGLEWEADQTPLRAGKASLYEGGIRVPLIVRWPGAVEPNRVCNVPVISVDFFSTILDMIGITPKHDVDGVSIVPLLKQTNVLHRDAIYWHYPHYHSAGIGPSSAIRQGDYKLIEWHEASILGLENRVELYNLREDIGESKNLAMTMPEKTTELCDKLEKWRQSVNAQMPVPNPAYDPAKEGRSR